MMVIIMMIFSSSSSTFPDFSGNSQPEVSPKLSLKVLQGNECKVLKVLNVTYDLNKKFTFVTISTKRILMVVKNHSNSNHTGNL